MSLEVGQIVDGKYRIVKVLGVGGMGAVYEGENTRIHRRVAIKVLHAAVAQKSDIVQRFEREAQAAGRIGSEHIVEVLDLGNLPSGERYMVMEFLDGEPLTNRIKVRGRLSPQETAEMLRQLLAGLGAAHQVGIVHRDLKPDNIFLIKRSGMDFVKLVDFGVSKFTAQGEDMSMTKTGAVMGTPYYMSPEQARGQPVDQRSDLYSVGVVAYQCVTGRVPFNAETFNELIFKIALEVPEPVENVVPGFDTNFAALIRKSMEREVVRRFQSAAEFAQALEAWRAGAGFAHAPMHAGHTGPGFTSHAGIGHVGNPALGQSGSGMHAMHAQSHALGQSGSNPAMHAPHLAQSASSLQAAGLQAPPPAGPPLGQSQVGLAVTSPQPKKSASVAVAIGVVALLGIGGGIAAFRYMGSSASTASSATTPDKPATAAATTTSESTAPPPPAASSAVAAEPPPSAAPSAEPSAAPAESAAPSSEPIASNPKTGKTDAGKTGTGKTGTTKTDAGKTDAGKTDAGKTGTGKTGTGGRTIDGSL